MQLSTSQLAQCRWTLQHQTVQAKPPEEKKKFTIFPLYACSVSRRVQQPRPTAYVFCVPLRSTAYHCVCWFYATLGYRLPHARSTPPPEPHVTYVAPIMIPSTADARNRSLIFIRMLSTQGNSSRDEMNHFLRLLCIHQNIGLRGVLFDAA